MTNLCLSESFSKWKNLWNLNDCFLFWNICCFGFDEDRNCCYETCWMLASSQSYPKFGRKAVLNVSFGVRIQDSVCVLVLFARVENWVFSRNETKCTGYSFSDYLHENMFASVQIVESHVSSVGRLLENGRRDCSLVQKFWQTIFEVNCVTILRLWVLLFH